MILSFISFLQKCIYADTWWHFGANERFLTDQTSRYVLQLTVHINDKKPVSCSGTIKMWQAAGSLLHFFRVHAVPSFRLPVPITLLYSFYIRLATTVGHKNVYLFFDDQLQCTYCTRLSVSVPICRQNIFYCFFFFFINDNNLYFAQ